MCRKSAGDLAFSDLQRQMMDEALTLARAAAARDEVPVGAVLYTDEGDLIAGAGNETIAAQDPSAHAEVLALRRAGAKLGNHRLPALNMAVTLEPCPMCAGAIFHARLQTLLYAAADPKSGACGSVVDLPALPQLNHHTQVHSGLRAAESATLLRDFFARRR